MDVLEWEVHVTQASRSTGLARLAERFKERLPAQLEVIEAMATDLSTDTSPETLTDLERLVHNLCGTAPVFGYTDLGAHAVQTEDFMIALKSGEEPIDDNNISRLRSMLFQLRALS